MLAIILVFAEVTLGSWNLRWFPSGRAEHRASPRVEAANCADAAEIVRRDVGAGKCILFFQELRDANAATNLTVAIARTNLVPAVTSAFKTRDRRLDWQQCAIATDYPVVDSGWGYWKGKPLPPRGYAYALVDCGKDGLIACWCVHLKSNYGATTDKKRADNIAKREVSAENLKELVQAAKSPDGRQIAGYVIAGDFNTDPFGGEFADEHTIRILESGGFRDCFSGLPLSARGTHPGNTRYPDSTLDHFLCKDLEIVGKPRLSKSVELSDHRMIWLKIRPSQ